MERIEEIVSRSMNYLSTMRLSDVVDVLIVAAIIYLVIAFVRRTNTYRVARGLVLLVLVLWISEIAGLAMLNSLLRRGFELGLIALVILFQPELRRLLERVGSGKLSSFIGAQNEMQTIEAVITQTALACQDMSGTKTGALIVFERTTSLNDPMSTGTIINADVTAELLRNIFYPKAPLHDGAAIIREGRVAAAGCMLPLSQNASLSRDLGMRHRAGIGMSEHSDAVVAIVSEETGSISVAIDGMLKRHLSPEMLEKILRAELMPQTEEKKRGLFGLFGSRRSGRRKNND